MEQSGERPVAGPEPLAKLAQHLALPESERGQPAASMTDKPRLGRRPSHGPADGLIRPSWRRFVILFLFTLNSANKSYQWLQVPSSTTKATRLYETDNYMINLASIVFMLAFVVLSWPACFVIESIGIRRAVVVASLGTASGAALKCFSCHPNGFWLLLAGQTLVALSEQLIFSLPSRLASVWFPDHQVSLCVALCVVGNQAGLVMGFLVPQWFLEGCETGAEIARGFHRMFLATAALSAAIFLVCLLQFDEAPPHPPGSARLKQLRLEQAEAGPKPAKLLGQSLAMFRNKQLLLLATSYGILVGLGYTIQTLLDQMLRPVWPPDQGQVVGNTGCLLIVAGILATPLWGRALDRWHAFKRINLIVAGGALLSLLLLAYAMVGLRSSPAVYLAATAFGLFHTGFIVAGLEYAVELTYPAPELLTSSLMNLMPQIHSIVYIFLGSYLTDNHGLLAANIFMVGLLLVALVFLLATRETLRRQAAIAQMTEKPALQLRA